MFLFRHRDLSSVLWELAFKSRSADSCRSKLKTSCFAPPPAQLRRPQILPCNLALLHLPRKVVANIQHLLLHEFLFLMGLLHLLLMKTCNVSISFFSNCSLIPLLTVLWQALRNQQMLQFPPNRTLDSTTCMNTYWIRIAKGLCLHIYMSNLTFYFQLLPHACLAH